jgi:hypothetical protein
MSAPRDKDDTTPGPPGITIEHMCDDVLQEELNVCIKQNAPRDKDDTTPGPPGITIEHMCDDVLQEELNVHIKQNHLEAQKR